MNDYLKELISSGLRSHDRGNFDYREIRIKSDVIKTAEGSADVSIGDTRVLVGIKLDVDEPMPDKPDEGNLITSAELLPLASPDFEPGPPNPESIELARVVDRALRSAEAIDMKSLFIEENKVWSVFVDIYVLNYDGNLFDASLLAAMTALMKTKKPIYKDNKVIRENLNEYLKVNNIVVSTTFAKIGDILILDPTGEEESIMNARYTIANDGNNIRAIQKGLYGSFKEEEIDNMVEISFKKYNELKLLIENATK